MADTISITEPFLLLEVRFYEIKKKKLSLVDSFLLEAFFLSRRTISFPVLQFKYK